MPQCSCVVNWASDRRMLVFQAVQAHTTGCVYRRADGVAGDTRDARPHCKDGVAGDTRDARPHCNDCGRYYSSSAALKVHMNMHKGVYRYWCEYCGRGFAATNNLKGHLAKHTGVKAFVCHICKEEFNYAYTLKDHMVKNHRDGATWLPAFASTKDVMCIETLSHTASTWTHVVLSYRFITSYTTRGSLQIRTS